MPSPFGPWDSLTVAEVSSLLHDAPFRWWLSGGHALDLHLGKTWRSHGDTDVSILRTDAVLLAELLEDWDIWFAAAGVLIPFDGSTPDASKSQNNLWARQAPGRPWELDILISDGTADEWVYRRQPAIRRPWPLAVLIDAASTPYLAPELQLLFKSKEPRPKDHLDAEVAIPTLDDAAKKFLIEHLPHDHPWMRLLPS